MSLLAPDEPQPVHVERAKSNSPFLFACDHAGGRMPKALGDLGLVPEHFERHLAYDVGIEPVARRLAAAVDAPLVAQAFQAAGGPLASNGGTLCKSGRQTWLQRLPKPCGQRAPRAA